MKKNLQEYKDQFAGDLEKLYAYLKANGISFEVNEKRNLSIDLSMAKDGNNIEYWADSVDIGNFWKGLNSLNAWGGDNRSKNESNINVGFFELRLP